MLILKSQRIKFSRKYTNSSQYGITFNTIPELVINKSEYQLPIGYITCHEK